ncbi:MAG: pilus assembly protein, partial [Alphaproteobacteria bacterium]|nr:pilus assembly protein [Alphaproteobacteria bacterium]
RRYLTGGGQGPKNCYKSHGCVSKFVKIRKLLSENLKNLCQKRGTSAGGRSARVCASRFAKKLKTISENLKNLCRKRSVPAGGRFVKNPFAWFFRKRSAGVAILETALTLPVVLYIVFFSIELIRMELAQTAVDSITKEFTFYLMAKGKIVQEEVDAIFLKYKPWGIPIGNFRYYIYVYKYMTTPPGETDPGVMDAYPYGGSHICWIGNDYANPYPNRSPTRFAINKHFGTNGEDTSAISEYLATLSKYQTAFTNKSQYGEVEYLERSRLLETGNTSGYIFVLTVAVKFPFSSPFVAKLFNGGSNSTKPGVYILWARGSGMFN